MSYGDDVYNKPEMFGLATVGDIDWSDGFYQFDYYAVWVDADKRLYSAEDSGCSCPSPFENFTDKAELTHLRDVAELESDLKHRLSKFEESPYSSDKGEVARLRNEIPALIALAKAAVA